MTILTVIKEDELELWECDICGIKKEIKIKALGEESGWVKEECNKKHTYHICPDDLTYDDGIPVPRCPFCLKYRINLTMEEYIQKELDDVYDALKEHEFNEEAIKKLIVDIMKKTMIGTLEMAYNAPEDIGTIIEALEEIFKEE